MAEKSLVPEWDSGLVSLQESRSLETRVRILEVVEMA